MEILVTIIQFLAVLALVVVVHEWGHFAAAKAMGIQVNEFAIGFPPRLLGFRKGETLYSLNLLPLGGFVKLEGENDPSKPRSLASKGVGTRFLVLVAGPFMNAVLAVVLLTGLFMFTVDELSVRGVSPDSPAEMAGVLPGDTLLRVNHERVRNFHALADRINAHRGEEIEWLIRRDGAEMRLLLVPRANPPEGQGATGITVQIGGRQQASPVRPPWEALWMGLKRTGLVLEAMKDEVSGVVSGGKTPEVAGPIGIAQLTGEVARDAGLISLVPLAALFSISLAVFNILPFPALDGGRLAFVILEWVRRGKKIPPEKEGLVHLVGFVVLIAIIITISYNDITRIVDGNSLLR